MQRRSQPASPASRPEVDDRIKKEGWPSSAPSAEDGMGPESLQERYAPLSECFGCGPANDLGLKIRSVVEGELVVARWTPQPHHHAFGEFLNGGIISTVLDCHGNWAGAYSLMVRAGASSPPPTVTSSILVEFLRPTRMGPLLMEARTKEIVGRRVAVVEATLKASGELTAKLRGTFVAVKPNHPAASRWFGPSGATGESGSSARGK